MKHWNNSLKNEIKLTGWQGFTSSRVGDKGGVGSDCQNTQSYLFTVAIKNEWKETPALIQFFSLPIKIKTEILVQGLLLIFQNKQAELWKVLYTFKLPLANQNHCSVIIIFIKWPLNQNVHTAFQLKCRIDRTDSIAYRAAAVWPREAAITQR